MPKSELNATLYALADRNRRAVIDLLEEQPRRPSLELSRARVLRMSALALLAVAGVEFERHKAPRMF